MKRFIQMMIAFVLIFALIVPVSAGAVSLDQAVKGTGGEPLSSLSTLAGSGVYGDNFEPAVQSGDAVFRSPAGLLVLENGTILIADAKNHRIRQLKDGEVSNYAGFVYLEIDDKGLPIGALVDEQKSAAVFNHPQGMAVDGQGNIYVADTMNHAVRKIDTRGNVSTIAGNGVLGSRDGQGADAQFYQPSDVAVAEDGTVYVADTLNHAIRQISPDGKVATLNRASENRIIEFVEGYVTEAGGFQDGELAKAQFNEPFGLALDSKGNLYVADSGNHRIRYIDLEQGTVTTVAGSHQLQYEERALYAEAGYQDGPADEAQFNFPKGLALIEGDVLIIADSMNHAVRALQGGKVMTLTGNGSAGLKDGIEAQAQLHFPTDVAVTPNGDILIADTYNNRIRQLTLYELPGNLSNEIINVVYDDERVVMDTAPELVNDCTMVPVRAVAEQMGYAVHYEQAASEITLARGDMKVQFRVGDTTMTVIKAGEQSQQVQQMIDAAPYLKQNRVYVPIRFFSEAFGYDVQWDGTTKTVIIR